jgi:hypothetical protein
MNEERKRARLSVAAMSARMVAIPGGFPLLSPAGGGRRAGQCSWEMYTREMSEMERDEGWSGSGGVLI